MASINKIIYPSGKKVWKVRWRENRKQREKNFDRSNDATDFKISIEATQRDGTYVSPSKLPCRVFFNSWVLKKGTTVSYKTQSSYTTTINKINELLGDIILQKLSVQDIETMYSNLNESGLSSTTCNYYHRILRSALQQALKERLIPYNPADVADAFKKSKYEAQIIHPNEVKIFLTYFSGDYMLEMPICIALFAGLRLSEICGLKWSDVNYNRKTLNVQRTIAYRDGTWHEQTTKNTKSRIVPITNGLVQMLRKHKEIQNSINESIWILSYPDGSPLRIDYLSKLYVKHRPTEYENIRFHDLRHTAATLMLYHGSDLKSVSSILGHSSISITADIYISKLEELNRQAVNSLDIYMDDILNSNIIPIKNFR